MADEAQRAFLPNFCAIRMVFAVVVSAELLAIVLTLGAFPAADMFWDELSRRSLYVQWVALSVSALYCGLRLPLGRLSHAHAGIIAWCMILLVTLGVFMAAQWLNLRGESPVMPALAQHLAIAGIVGAVLLRYLYEQHRERQRELAESQARLQALQARIRPHFLFNSMNTIASLTRVDADLAEQVVHDLSDLFRATLSDADRASTLEREFDLARGYLRIEGQRLGQRLRVEWDVEELPLDVRLPALLLQPLLENAVYHGIEPSAQPGTISIDIQRKSERLEIILSNPVPKMTRTQTGNKMALANIEERLQLHFDAEATLTTKSEDGRFEVRIVLPCVRGGK